MPRNYDVIVVGAGVEGSSSALACVQDGHKTLLLEQVKSCTHLDEKSTKPLQFPLPHSRGSSHGASRITRYAYPDDHAMCTEMMLDGFPAWNELAKKQDVKLFECILIVFLFLKQILHTSKKHRLGLVRAEGEEYRAKGRAYYG